MPDGSGKAGVTLAAVANPGSGYAGLATDSRYRGSLKLNAHSPIPKIILKRWFKQSVANDSANYYWSRRGPSCHLNYSTPAADKEYFYSELTVPLGEDKEGSYFMANGFGEGYFGIQVNSATERRVLFSVWDPAQGQTTLLRNGANVTAGRQYLSFSYTGQTRWQRQHGVHVLVLCA
jgi:hypothetical protein